MQHSPTAAALSTPFLVKYAPNSPQLNGLVTRFRESENSVSMNDELKRLKKFRSN